MSIEALAHELIGHQEKSKRLLESGNIDAWLDELSQELRLVEQLRARLLNHSIVVTDDPAVNRAVVAAADGARCFVSAAGDGESSSARPMAVLRRGDLEVAIGTSGRAPGVAPWIRRQLATVVGQEYGVLIKEWRLLQRAVFVLDRAGRVAYADYVPNQMAEPDYAVILDHVGG